MKARRVFSFHFLLKTNQLFFAYAFHFPISVLGRLVKLSWKLNSLSKFEDQLGQITTSGPVFASTAFNCSICALSTSTHHNGYLWLIKVLHGSNLIKIPSGRDSQMWGRAFATHLAFFHAHEKIGDSSWRFLKSFSRLHEMKLAGLSPDRPGCCRFLLVTETQCWCCWRH